MIDCIVGFVLNYEELVGLCYRWSTCNIPYSNASEYSNTNTFNFSVSKYYVTQKKKKQGITASNLMLVNKLVKFESKAKNKYFFVIFLEKKDRYVLYSRFTFHNKNS